jgi:hypothetical protein
MNYHILINNLFKKPLAWGLEQGGGPIKKLAKKL